MNFLTTPGFESIGWTQLQLQSGRHLAMRLGMLMFNAEGEVLVHWRMGAPCQTGWCEMAIAVGAPTPGARPLQYVATVDMTQAFAETPAEVERTTSIVLPAIEPPSYLWLVVAAWQVPGVIQMPYLVAPTWTDPVGSGAVCYLDADDRPSQFLANKVSPVFAADRGIRPIAASVSVQVAVASSGLAPRG